MTTTAGHSFYIGPIGSFYNQVNDTGSWEPLVLFSMLSEIEHFFWNFVLAKITITIICIHVFLASCTSM
jgi:hypothetical protein